MQGGTELKAKETAKVARIMPLDKNANQTTAKIR
jgi:hypothetical protein